MATQRKLRNWLAAGGVVGVFYACSGHPDAVLRPQGGDDTDGGEGANSGRGGSGATGGTIINTRGGTTGKGGKGSGGSAADTGEGGDNGQGGFRDAGLPDSRFDYDASHGGQGGACDNVTDDATLVKRPMDIIISIDNSDSMAGEISAVIQRINGDFAQIIEASGIDYRVIMVSRYGDLDYTLGDTNWSVCIGPPLGNASCPPNANPAYPPLVNTARFFHHSTDIGSRNMWCRLTTSYTTTDEYPAPSRNGWTPLAPMGWRSWLRANAFKAFIGITDDMSATSGGQNCPAASGFNDTLAGAQAFDRAIRTLDPAQFGAYNAADPAMGRNYRWYGIVGMSPKAGAARTQPYQPTEPVVTTVCTNGGGNNDGVAAGVGYQELARMTGGLRYSNCLNANFNEIFNAIAQGVIEGSRASCEYDVPVSGSGIIDPNKTVVSYRVGGVPPGTQLGRVASDTACGAGGGYYFSQDLRKIFLCPSTCTTVQADTAARINIDFGCLGS